MALLLKALCILGALLAISLESSNGSRLPQVCNCGRSTPRFPPQNITDFSINERTNKCGTEIILTTNRADVKKVCLDPSKNQGKRILHCWTNIIQREEGRKAECIRPMMRPRAGVESRTTEVTATATATATATGFMVTKELLFPSSTSAAAQQYTSTPAAPSSSS